MSLAPNLVLLSIFSGKNGYLLPIRVLFKKFPLKQLDIIKVADYGHGYN
jgi:hypothetical protein